MNATRPLTLIIIVSMLLILWPAGATAEATSCGIMAGRDIAGKAVIWKGHAVHYQNMVRNFLERLKASLAIVRRNRHDSESIRRQTEMRMRQVKDQIRINKQRQQLMTENLQGRLRSLRETTERMVHQHRLRTQLMKPR